MNLYPILLFSYRIRKFKKKWFIYRKEKKSKFLKENNLLNIKNKQDFENRFKDDPETNQQELLKKFHSKKKSKNPLKISKSKWSHWNNWKSHEEW
jgi:hypothetical protein